MARNEEKAFNLFNKWQTFKTDSHLESLKKRPSHTSLCNNLADAKRFHRELIQDIIKKISLIKNIKDKENTTYIKELNDTINKLVKTKISWEYRIKELNGSAIPSSSFKSTIDLEGIELPHLKGYKYYGEAQNLPVIRDLINDLKNEKLNQNQLTKKKKKLNLITKNLSSFYYGYDINNQNNYFDYFLNNYSNKNNIESNEELNNENEINDEDITINKSFKRKLIQQNNKDYDEFIGTVLKKTNYLNDLEQYDQIEDQKFNQILSIQSDNLSSLTSLLSSNNPSSSSSNTISSSTSTTTEKKVDNLELTKNSLLSLLDD